MSSAAETVLVVDDDAYVRSALKFLLEIEGFRVQLYDGSAALLAEHELPEPEPARRSKAIPSTMPVCPPALCS